MSKNLHPANLPDDLSKPSCCDPTPGGDTPSCCEPASAQELPSCCAPAPNAEGKGFLMGLFYGLVPHTFCILFIVLSVLGATAATSVIKRFLYIPYLFQIIVLLSFGFATLSAVLYLKRQGRLSLPGARARWKYLTILYTTTVGINLLFFLVIFPIVANSQFSRGASVVSAEGAGAVTLQVDIPCPGHAPLIMDELKTLDGVQGIKYGYPNSFRVTYDTAKLSVPQILDLQVFQEFRAVAK